MKIVMKHGKIRECFSQHPHLLCIQKWHPSVCYLEPMVFIFQLYEYWWTVFPFLVSFSYFTSILVLMNVSNKPSNTSILIHCGLPFLLPVTGHSSIYNCDYYLGFILYLCKESYTARHGLPTVLEMAPETETSLLKLCFICRMSCRDDMAIKQ